MTQMGLDIEAIEHLDFDHAPPCEAAVPCDHAAAWVVTYPCCVRQTLLCDGCWAQVKRLAEKRRAQTWEHLPCGAHMTYREFISMVMPL